MRFVGLLIVLLAGCPEAVSTVDPARPVAELSGPEQQELCDSFVAAICPEVGGASGEYEEFCSSCVLTSGCAAASSTRKIATSCAVDEDDRPITAGMVNECADSGALEVCRQGGGCMFDALEAICE
ncbi:MAG TPA: hypothetical protein VIU61_11575 [Kofleriaceae bacterium]